MLAGTNFRRTRFDSHLRDKPVAPPGFRHNELVLARLLAEHSAQLRNGLVEVVLLDDHVRPQILQQPFFRYQLTRPLDEIEQRIE